MNARPAGSRSSPPRSSRRTPRSARSRRSCGCCSCAATSSAPRRCWRPIQAPYVWTDVDYERRPARRPRRRRRPRPDRGRGRAAAASGRLRRAVRAASARPRPRRPFARRSWRRPASRRWASQWHAERDAGAALGSSGDVMPTPLRAVPRSAQALPAQPDLRGPGRSLHVGRLRMRAPSCRSTATSDAAGATGRARRTR